MEVSQRATSSTKEKYSAGMMGGRYGQLLLLLTYPCCWLWFIVAAAISNKGWSSCRAAPAVPRRVTAGGGGGQGSGPAARWGHPQAAGLITSTMLAVLTIIFAQAAPSNGSLAKSRNGRRGARRHGRTTFCTLPRLPPARRSCRHSSVTTKTMLVDSVALVTRR